MSRPTPIKPGPGQESVWDYPRPPRLEASTASIQVVLSGVQIASTTRSWRVLETSHPPTYYLPREAFVDGALREVEGGSFCEWKGRASYFDVHGGGQVASRSAWTYVEPTGRFADLAGAVALMPAAMDHCVVDGEVVVPQEGGFYGGWITSKVVGPFKGSKNSWGW
ncbi:MAG: DUF427 domain-containing protein [Nocardioides sp.]